MGNHGVGMPQAILLNYFGKIIYDAFGDWPYQVGSSLKTTQWRDVDVRLILDDERYAELFGKSAKSPMESKRWQAMCLAFSVLGKQMTGLPIDFQIQSRNEANEKYGSRDHQRSCLMMYANIFDNHEE